MDKYLSSASDSNETQPNLECIIGTKPKDQEGTKPSVEEYVLDGVLEETVANYNDFILSKRRMWRVPEKELKVYLVKNKVIPHVCKICKCEPTWRKKPLELILDRINNDQLDNDIDNLRFLCPNCYSQVKKKTTIFEKNLSAKMIKCEKCGKRIKYKTFSMNKQTNIERLCKPCLEQERIEAKLNKRSSYPRNKEI